MEMCQPGKRAGPFWRDLAAWPIFHSVVSCRDPGYQAKQSGAEHHIFSHEQPILVGGMKSFQLRMCEITC